MHMSYQLDPEAHPDYLKELVPPQWSLCVDHGPNALGGTVPQPGQAGQYQVWVRVGGRPPVRICLLADDSQNLVESFPLEEAEALADDVCGEYMHRGFVDETQFVVRTS